MLSHSSALLVHFVQLTNLSPKSNIKFLHIPCKSSSHYIKIRGKADGAVNFKRIKKAVDTNLGLLFYLSCFFLGRHYGFVNIFGGFDCMIVHNDTN